jgi:hypothetical protein
MPFALVCRLARLRHTAMPSTPCAGIATYRGQAVLPSHILVLTCAYGWHSRLLLQRSVAVVQSQSGVRQNDSLRPLLFTLTLQGPLEEVAAKNPVWPLAYANDTFLCAPLGQPSKPTMPSQLLPSPLDSTDSRLRARFILQTTAAAATVTRCLGVRHT